tara:strand:- start:242 stop:583 length:342 start_codon:yes stop_codon:yes gene_type:complete
MLPTPWRPRVFYSRIGPPGKAGQASRAAGITIAVPDLLKTGAPTAAPDALTAGREAHMVTADARGAPDATSIASVFEIDDDRQPPVHHTPAAADDFHRSTGTARPAGVRRRDF